jgi:hypothetical protein
MAACALSDAAPLGESYAFFSSPLHFFGDAGMSAERAINEGHSHM